MLEADERWYLVQTLPKSERKAAFNLTAQGFEPFLPEYRKTVRHARKLVTVKAPLFPGYLFLPLNLARDQWLCVRSTIGVARLYSSRDGTPIAVPYGVVDTLVSQCEGELVRLDGDLHEGQNVRILSGPFADFVGNLNKLNDSERVQVLLQMMGTEVRVSLERSLLAPAA
jgi:transcription elongation factor/antiterminator RfaH